MLAEVQRKNENSKSRKSRESRERRKKFPVKDFQILQRKKCLYAMPGKMN